VPGQPVVGSLTSSKDTMSFLVNYPSNVRRCGASLHQALRRKRPFPRCSREIDLQRQSVGRREELRTAGPAVSTERFPSSLLPPLLLGEWAALGTITFRKAPRDSNFRSPATASSVVAPCRWVACEGYGSRKAGSINLGSSQVRCRAMISDRRGEDTPSDARRSSGLSQFTFSALG
jgi:hypothetical protein